jgi:hypothetical protein
MNALLMFSGGIDSTVAAYEYLKNNPDKKLLMHHVILKNDTNRFLKEKEATENICNWFRKNNLNNFEIIYSVFDYGDIKNKIWDIEIMAFYIYIHLCNPKYSQLSHVLLPFYLNRDLRGKYKKFEAILNLVNFYKKIQVKFDYLFWGKAKRDVIVKLPSDLLKLTWYCRTPENDRPCQKCYTCKEVTEASNFPLKVLCAGSKEVNGIYLKNGDKNGKPKYIKGDIEMSFLNFWIIQNLKTEIIYYYDHQKENTFNPFFVKKWVGAEGLKPAPKIIFTDNPPHNPPSQTDEPLCGEE